MRTLTILISFCFIVLSHNIFAHTPLKSSTPKDSAVLQKAPTALVLTFREAVTLAKVELMQNGDENVAIDFQASPTAATEYSIKLPTLTAGQYQVNWVAIGADTHKIDGSIGFAIEPGAAGATSDAAQSHQDHSQH